MKPTIRTWLLAAALAAACWCQAQVVTQLGRENMHIPKGERPDAEATATRRAPNVEMDTTATYYALADSAGACIARNDWAGAERWTREAIACMPESDVNSLLLSNLGTILRHEGRLDEALGSYNMALDLTPNAVTLLLNRAALLLQLGRTTLAEADLERVRELDATDAESRYTLGVLAVERGDNERAKALFEEIAKANPRSSLAHEGLAVMLKRQGDYAAAVEHYSVVIADHADAQLLAGRADCLLMLRRLTEAADDIHRAIETDPDDGYLYVLRAKLNKMRWNLDDAKRDVELAVQHGVDRNVAENLLK